jgi:hypothetical protein
MTGVGLVGAYFTLLHCIKTGSGAQPAFYSVDNGVFSLVVKQRGREPDHSIVYSVIVTNAQSYTNTLPCVFIAKCLNKPGNNYVLSLFCHCYLKCHKAKDNIIN